MHPFVMQVMKSGCFVTPQARQHFCWMPKSRARRAKQGTLQAEHPLSALPLLGPALPFCSAQQGACVSRVAPSPWMHPLGRLYLAVRTRNRSLFPASAVRSVTARSRACASPARRARMVLCRNTVRSWHGRDGVRAGGCWRGAGELGRAPHLLTARVIGGTHQPAQPCHVGAEDGDEEADAVQDSWWEQEESQIGRAHV